MTREELVHSAIEEMRYQNQIDELYHHGILGMKWDVRRYQNEDGSLTEAGKKKYADNYSEAQRSRDRQVYSRGAERRINQKMLQGRSISEARSYEADRVNSYRNKANSVKTKSILDIGGVLGGLAGGFASKHAVNAVSRYVNRPVMKDTPLNRFIGKHRQTINDGIYFLNGTRAGSIVRTSVGAAIGSNIGRSIPKTVSKGVMISGGYNPNKLR